MNVLKRISVGIHDSFIRFKMMEHAFTITVAVLIGIVAGFGAVGVRLLIKFFNELFFSAGPSITTFLSHFHHLFEAEGESFLEVVRALPWYHKLLAPAIGGAIVGPIIYFFAREAKGHGVPEVMDAMIRKGGAIRPRVGLVKALASAISIGSGGSVGREGPIVQIGSSIGSTVGQLLRVSSMRMRTFVGCGAAGGIAAAFNAPIAGALFSVEIILGDFGLAQFSPIVISSVVATTISRHFEGDFVAFFVPEYQLVNPLEFAPYLILGVVAGLVSVMFIKILYFAEDTFEHHVPIPEYLQPILGGLVIGAMGILFPQIYGVGYEAINMALYDEMAIGMLCGLIFVKIAATSITLASGGSGGIFAPSLFIGAMTGGCLGIIFHRLLPDYTASSGAYALVGMAALVSGTTHAPLTAIMIIFELTSDYKIILPLMVSSVISLLISSHLHKDSIYTLKLRRRGLDIYRGMEANVMRSLHVRDAMSADVQTIPEATPFKALVNLVAHGEHTYFPVVDQEQRLCGIVSINDVRGFLFEDEYLRDLIVARDVASTDVVTVVPHDDLNAVMKKFIEHNINEIPVVDPGNPHKVVGCIRKEELLEVYNKEMVKREVMGTMARQLTVADKEPRVHLLEGYSMAEVEAPPLFWDKSIMDLGIRANYNLEVVMIKRWEKVKGPGQRWARETIKMVPKAEDLIKQGDILVVMGDHQSIQRIKNMV